MCIYAAAPDTAPSNSALLAADAGTKDMANMIAGAHNKILIRLLIFFILAPKTKNNHCFLFTVNYLKLITRESRCQCNRDGATRYCRN
jgi:hypothetical protein